MKTSWFPGQTAIVSNPPRREAGLSRAGQMRIGRGRQERPGRRAEIGGGRGREGGWQSGQGPAGDRAEIADGWGGGPTCLMHSRKTARLLDSSRSILDSLSLSGGASALPATISSSSCLGAAGSGTLAWEEDEEAGHFLLRE